MKNLVLVSLMIASASAFAGVEAVTQVNPAQLARILEVAEMAPNSALAKAVNAAIAQVGTANLSLAALQKVADTNPSVIGELSAMVATTGRPTSTDLRNEIAAVTGPVTQVNRVNARLSATEKAISNGMAMGVARPVISTDKVDETLTAEDLATLDRDDAEIAQIEGVTALGANAKDCLNKDSEFTNSERKALIRTIGQYKVDLKSARPASAAESRLVMYGAYGKALNRKGAAAKQGVEVLSDPTSCAILNSRFHVGNANPENN